LLIEDVYVRRIAPINLDSTPALLIIQSWGASFVMRNAHCAMRIAQLPDEQELGSGARCIEMNQNESR
jgi:hypothetical protein